MKEVNVLPKKKTTPKILSIETLYITTPAGQTVKRFARTLIDEAGNKTRQILADKKWQNTAEDDFYAMVESTRDELIAELSTSTKPEKEETKEEKN